MKSILLTGMIGVFALHLEATTFFVKQGATGSGATWSDATGDLSKALASANAGDEIWIAKGTYYPSDKDRKKFFLIPSGVKVYGGFAGNESSRQQRNPQSNKTVLSGNVGAKTDYLDNSYTIVFLENANEHSLLDGLVIADGNADGTGPTADIERCGAGIYVDGSGPGNMSKPVIQNCIFQNNYARDGAAVYLNGRSGEASATFRNCQFLNNKADLDGGAVFSDGRHGGKSNPIFEDCIFTGNTGNYGGALCNYGGKGESNPHLQNCVFRNNEAYLRGGAIYNMDVEGLARPVINACQFVDNKAVAGKGMYTFSKHGKEDDGQAAMSTTLKIN
jgi:hypothetical protein